MAEADAARKFVLDTLQAFDRQGIDVEAVIKKKLDGKYLPLPTHVGSISASSSSTSLCQLPVQNSLSPSRSRLSNLHKSSKRKGGIDFHSSLQNEKRKIKTLETRQIKPAKKASEIQRKDRRRKRMSYKISYANAQSLLGKAWAQYASEALPESLTEARLRKLVGVSMSIIGCSVRVVRSKAKNNNGLEGIVTRLTSRMFQIVTPTNATRMVPREGTVLQIKVLNRSWEIMRAPIV